MADNFGEWSGTKKATFETQVVCNQVKIQVEEKTEENYMIFTADEYRRRVMIYALMTSISQDLNLLIKVHVGQGNYIHLSVSQELDGTLHLLGVQQNKTKDDPLEPFKFGC